MADIDYDKLAAAIAKGNRGTGNSSGGSATGGFGSAEGTGKLNTAFKELVGNMNPLGKAGEVATQAFGAAKDVVNDLQAAIQPNLSTWRDLSASGANFGNDIVAMSAAAAGTRMELGEFADLVKKNTTTFTGLGSNVANGAKAFASLSKDMQDSGVVDQLKAIGLTSKDANNALALTLGNQFTVNMNDAKSKQQAIESATKMATEMDLMSKLTGKTRAEQEELMKKAQMDAQFQAKLQLDTIGMTEQEALKYRNTVTQAYNKAQMEGMGDVFKEVYAVGTVQTEAAANKMGLLPEQAGATEREIAALRKQNYADAEKEQKNRELQISKDAKDKNKLELIALGDANVASKQLGESFINNQAIAKAYASKQKELMETDTFRNASKEQQDQMVKDAVDKDLKATQESTSAGSQSTKALVQLESRAKDVESAFMNGIVLPINEKLAPSFEKLNNSVLSATGSTKGKDGKIQTKVQEVEGGMKGGVEQPDQKTKTKGDFTTKAAENTKTGANESTISGVGRVAGGLVSEVAGVINKAIAPAKMAEGGVVEPKPGGTSAIIGEGGKTEAVIPLDKLDGMLKSKEGGINIADISKTIATTISSAQGPTMGGAASAPLSKNEKFQTEDWADATQAEIAEGLEGSKKQLAMWTKDAQETEQKIAEIKTESSKRQLSTGEQFELSVLEKENAKNQRAIGYHQSTINVLSNLDEYKARLETESKEKTVTAAEAATKIAEDLGLKQIEIAEKASEEQKTVLTNHQKSVLEYAYTDEAGKQMQLENAKKRVADEKNTIAEKNSEILALEQTASSRELTVREQSKLERLQKEVENKQESLQFREDELAVYSNLDKLKAENEIKTKTTVTTLTEEQLAVQAEAERRIAQLKADGVDVETEFANAVQVIKSDSLGTELAKLNEAELKKQEALKTSVVETLKINGKVVDLNSDSGKAALDKVKSEMSKVSTGAGMPGMPDFSTMFGGEKGKLPPFLENLNAKVKDMNPVSIPAPKEENKIAGNTAQSIKKEPSPGKKINPETGEEYTPVPPAAKKDTKPVVGTVEQVGLKDLHTSLEHLNKSMAKLISYSEQTASAAQAQVKATKGLSSNKFN